MLTRLLDYQAERLARDHVQDVVLRLLEAPYFAFHDPGILFEVDLERYGEDVILAGMEHGTWPGFQQHLYIGVQTVFLLQKVVNLRQGRLIKGPAQPLLCCALQLLKRNIYIVLLRHIGREPATPARLTWEHQHPST